MKASLDLHYENTRNQLNILDKTLNNELESPLWWDLLKSGKNLEKNFINQSLKINEYLGRVEAKHWILNKILTTLLEKSQEAEQLVKTFNRSLLRCQSRSFYCHDGVIKQQLIEQLHVIKSNLNIENSMEFKLLDSLINWQENTMSDSTASTDYCTY